MSMPVQHEHAPRLLLSQGQGLQHALALFSALCNDRKLQHRCAPCLLSSQGQGTVHTKNWEPLVAGPALAMLSRPGTLCLSLKFSSSKVGP